ncbi:MAG: hypothetical protein CMQ83_01100 [Gammaproteobacteria bacterium]|nr:hypothetical protein [Gammaproteobacteria bacterium]|tara:strand:- start:4179 stop:5627 length:1449 start_codon:yes stop_codon:yes gene_type:complete
MGNKILVVGSGPSGLIALNELSKNEKLDVYLIDNSNYKSMDKIDKNCIFKNKFIYGNRNSSLNSPIDNQHALFQKNKLPNISKSFGGFSNVWGGTVLPVSNDEQFYYSELGINLEDEYKELENYFFNTSSSIKNEIPNFLETKYSRKALKKLNLLSLNNLYAEFSDIAFNKNLTKEILTNNEICKFCKSYKWYCSKDPIWSSKKDILKLLKNKNVKYLEDTKLVKFNEGATQVECLLKIKEKTNTKYFSKVILASGPISTSEIVINSGIVDEALLENSDLLSIPIIKVFNFQRNKTSFADLFITFTNNKNNFFIQFYNYSRSLLHLGRDNVPLLKYLNFLPDLFFSCFGGVFLYIDSNLSSKLKISFNHNLNEFEYLPINPKNKKLLNKSLKILFNNLKKVKILPFKFMIKNYYFGSSNHLGGQFPHSLIKQPNKTDIYGRLDGLERVFIVDSSVLPKVNTGPLTFTIMANSKRICKKILEF